MTLWRLLAVALHIIRTFTLHRIRKFALLRLRAVALHEIRTVTLLRLERLPVPLFLEHSVVKRRT
jgi:hypothetical protein